ncbi:uncharacterized protein LOC133847477 [Drosophila sulfurigaster albostrigata]|uniref:uncharacterized protein LOC133847477 n=1 Tax=Drosophila sulfurigaster albostrigata TaxID=89887 RepID=UPI002D21AE01|nr:uncharacterized protein LOC133847477 [Drosophila sulfurigaster albostrigata]
MSLDARISQSLNKQVFGVIKAATERQLPMGHQLSRPPTDVVASRKSQLAHNTKSKSKSSQYQRRSQAAAELELQREQQQRERQREQARYSLQIAEGGEAATNTGTVEEVRQIIIKIQLAEMQIGNGNATGEEQVQQLQLEQQQQELALVEGAAASGATTVADTLNANEQIVNVTLGAAIAGGAAAATVAGGNGTGADPKTTSGAGAALRTAGSSTEAPKTNIERQLVVVNNNNLAGSVASASAAVKTLQLHEVNDDAIHDDDDDDDESEIATSSLLRRRRSSSAEGVEYCEVLEPPPVNEMLSSEAQRRAQALNSGNSCCRNRSSRSSKTNSLNTMTTSLPEAAATSTGGSTSKRRCCKCKCIDALRGLRGMMEFSNSNSNANAAAIKDKKESTRSSKTRSSADRRSTPPTLSASTAASTGAAASRRPMQRQRNSVAVAEPSQLAIWARPANAHGDVIIRISSQPQPQFVMETQAPNSCTVCTSSNSNSNTATPLVTMVVAAPPPATPAPPADAANVLPPMPIEAPRPVSVAASGPYGVGVTVHSQIDFMHCLVPDLEKIINSNFYFGKMDRYEAERLLEGKPEGTFLLRDSAQEEFLFSVTFRKYGRSLHARIEQSGHKFSFDCHDPCVFSALTVTGLLEHYKDPSCVMFFEPCLTMPLHRRQTFSLQQLARATIVSNTTYDGINQLELPGQLKSYLKEYHYKQKLRVKPCDAHTPTPYYANI